MNTLAYRSNTNTKSAAPKIAGRSNHTINPRKRRSPVLSRRELRRAVLEILG